MDRIPAPHLLLVGSSGRNAGKTEFACAVLRSHAGSRPIAAAKVTTVHERVGGTCIRGGEGCGACLDLTGPFRLDAEDGSAVGKDTARMLAAGASASWWLRARREHLADAARVLLDAIGPDTPCVCESNSLAAAVEPGIFAIVHERGTSEVKGSCRDVWPFADEIVTSGDGAFDLDPAGFLPTDDGWRWRRRAAAIVLAGGRSSRMGRPKALLPIEGRPLVEHVVRQLEPWFEEVIVGAARDDEYPFLSNRVVGDRQPDGGALVALGSALEASRHDLNLVVPCDLPEVPRDLVRLLFRAARDADGAVPVTADGLLEPLLAVYRRSVVPAVWNVVARGERRVVDFHADCDIRRVLLPPHLSLVNLNTPEDYRAYCESRPARRS